MEELLDPEAAAKVLGIKTITVYKWVSERKIPFLKVGGALRFRPSALEAWLSDCEHKVSETGRGNLWPWGFDNSSVDPAPAATSAKGRAAGAGEAPIFRTTRLA